MGLLIEPGGTLQVWMTNTAHKDGYDAAGRARAWDTTGLSIAFTLYQIPGLTNVVSAAVGSDAGYAVLADGQLLSWGAGGYGLLGSTPLAEFEERKRSRASARIRRSRSPLSSTL